MLHAPSHQHSFATPFPSPPSQEYYDARQLLKRSSIAPPGPYVMSVEDTIVPAVADTVIDEWLDDVGRKAAVLLARQLEAVASRRLFEMSPCPPWLYKALHRRCRHLAATSDPHGNAQCMLHFPAPTPHLTAPTPPPPSWMAGSPTSQVSEITCVKGGHGGKQVEDLFEVTSLHVVDLILNKFNIRGHGSLIFHDSNNTAVMLVPPLQFKFRTQRQVSADARVWPTVLIVTGHFMCLVDRKGPKGPRWAFDMRADYPLENKHACKIALAEAMHAMHGPQVVPARLLEWLEILLPESESDSDSSCVY